MPRSALTGTRVRERRLRIGMKQADLARAAAISPAYLNLIEHNRRRVGEALLSTLAGVLGVEEAALAEGAESALFEGLREAAAGADAVETPPEIARIEEFVGRFPGWAALMAERQSRVGALERAVEALSERMTHDPFLSASLHEVLSAVTSVRSTAAILAESEEIAPEWRARFHSNIYEDSIRLSEAAQALVAYMDMTQESETGLSSPQEEVEAWLAMTDYHLAALERSHPPAPESLIAGVPELATGAARKLALAHIERYRADALKLPLEGFVQALTEFGVEPAALAARFGVTPAAVFRRLVTLPKGAGPDLGLVICDASGAMTFRRALTDFTLPRHGAACPLWPLYEVLARPQALIRVPVEMAGRAPHRFVLHAFAEARHPGGYDGPQVIEAMMLIRAATAPRGPAERPVGPSCRICPRGACVARREPSILTEDGV
jgi:predicted transcriptional regulator/DNA-binding XRE family transcriptional regulator